jgi:hypothetical protein
VTTWDVSLGHWGELTLMLTGDIWMSFQTDSTICIAWRGGSPFAVLGTDETIMHGLRIGSSMAPWKIPEVWWHARSIGSTECPGSIGAHWQLLLFKQCRRHGAQHVPAALQLS